MARVLPACIALLAASGSLAAPDESALIARGDAAWAQRAEGRDGTRAAGGRISEAIRAYEEALAARPDDLEARWKLVRALYFQGEFVAGDREEKLEVFARARDLAEEGLDRLAEPIGGRTKLDELEPREVAAAVGTDPAAAPLHFWAAAHWGLWGRHRGKIAAARQGVAGKIRRYSEVTIAIDERLENAGGHRVLGRLHAEAPKIPFITGWIDRQTAISELQRAVELAPTDLLSRLYLAEALIDYDRQRRAEGIDMLRRIVAARPNPDWLVEEEKAIADARLRLGSLGDG